MGWTVFDIFMGILTIGLSGTIIYAFIEIERHKSAQRKKWGALPKFRISCDMIWKKQWPYYGSHMMPECLWWMPEYPKYGETPEEMKARCQRYNEEPELCQID